MKLYFFLMITMMPMVALTARIKQHSHEKKTARNLGAENQEIEEIEAKRMTQDGAGPDVKPMTATEAEKALQDENLVCATLYRKFGNCTSSSHSINKAVHRCEEHKMPNDKRYESCRVSQAWMLEGDADHNVAWWTELHLGIMNAKVDKFKNKCAGTRWKLGWLTGQCSRRVAHVIRAMQFLPKATTVLMQMKMVPQRTLTRVGVVMQNTNNEMASLLVGTKASAEEKEVSDRLFKALTAMDRRGAPKKSSMEIFVNILVAIRSHKLEQADKLLKELEKEAPKADDLITLNNVNDVFTLMEPQVNAQIESIVEAEKEETPENEPEAEIDTKETTVSLSEMRRASKDDVGGGIPFLVAIVAFIGVIVLLIMSAAE